MTKINDIQEFLKQQKEKNIDVVFCDGFEPKPEPKPYHGQVCKLLAGSTVQNYLYKSQAHSQPALPLHKSHGLFPMSLRKRAKEVVNSRVGEVYGPSQLEQILSYNGFITDSYKIVDKEVYQQFVMNALQQKQPVIAYNDASMEPNEKIRTGEPGLKNGKFEHAITISGFYFEEGKLRLIVSQWNNFFHISFDKLFESTSQLSQKKEPETYLKYFPIPGKFNRRTWLEKDQLKEAINIIAGHSKFKQRFFSAVNKLWPKSKPKISHPPEHNSSLANTLTVIQGDSKKISVEPFNKYRIQSTPASDNEKDFSVSHLKLSR